jgi:hypothetical protein
MINSTISDFLKSFILIVLLILGIGYIYYILQDDFDIQFNTCSLQLFYQRIII